MQQRSPAHSIILDYPRFSASLRTDVVSLPAARRLGAEPSTGTIRRCFLDTLNGSRVEVGGATRVVEVEIKRRSLARQELV